MTQPTKWHPPSLIRVFAECSKGSQGPKLSSCGQPAKTLIRLGRCPGWCSDRADAQADMSVHWAHKSFCWFCHAAAHFVRHCGFITRNFMLSLTLLLVPHCLALWSPRLGKRELVYMRLVHFVSTSCMPLHVLCVFLSSSCCLGSAADCDCSNPWTFNLNLPFYRLYWMWKKISHDALSFHIYMSVRQNIYDMKMYTDLDLFNILTIDK